MTKHSRASSWWIVVIAWVLVATVPVAARADREIYLCRGGTGLTVLERNGDEIAVPRSDLGYMGNTFLGGEVRVKAREQDDILTLTLEVLVPPAGPKPGWNERSNQVFCKSKAEAGAYDLIRDEFLLSKPTDMYTSANVAFMHPVDDPRLIEYFTASQDTTKTLDAVSLDRLLELAAALTNDHPDDGQVRVLYWDALLRNGRIAELEQDLAEWKDRISALPPRWLANVLANAECEIASLRSTAQGNNAFDVISLFASRGPGLDAFFKAFPDVLSKGEYRRRNGSLLNNVPDFGDVQTVTKVVRTQATLELFRGRTKESWKQLLAAYRLGQMLTANREWIDQLVGTALRSIAIHGLMVVTLNASQSPDELEGFLREFRTLENNPPPVIGKRMLTVLGIAEPAAALLEYNVRRKHVDAWSALFYSASAARLAQLRSGEFPRTEKDLRSALGGSLPLDPFTSASIRLMTLHPEPGIKVYSVGPDEADQQSEVLYDSTNGTMSAGDVVLRVPVKREFPFPKGPVRADSLDSIIAQFPRGLPTDIFATRRTRGLGVASTRPLRIFSFGPDCNQSEADKMDDRSSYDYSTTSAIPLPTAYVPMVRYDPTNGTVSAGDLWVEVSPEIKNR